MRILAHIHTFNAGPMVEKAVAGVLAQTRPAEGIVLVDNGSTDDTLRRPLPAGVTVVRHERNLGTSGAVASGLKVALEQGYDWMWVLDADSVLRADALEQLVRLHDDLPAVDRKRTGALCSMPVILPWGKQVNPQLLTPRGSRLVDVESGARCYESDTSIWSGSMYNLAAVREVGMPFWGSEGCWEKFNLDWGDTDYGYQIHHAGYSILNCPASVLEHPIGKCKRIRLFGNETYTSCHPPFRRYLFFRNMVYFYLHRYRGRVRPAVDGFFLQTLMANLLIILFHEDRKTLKLAACLRGLVDGYGKRLDGRFAFS